MNRKVILNAAVIFLFSVLFTSLPPVEARPAPRNGVQEERYSNGNLKFQAKYRDGQLVRRRYFYENGRLKIEYLYKDGQLVRVRTYSENGKRKSLRDFFNGYVKLYDEDGRLDKTLDLKNRHLNDLPPSYFFSH